MSFAPVCNSAMYRSVLFTAVALFVVIGCNKPKEEPPAATPPAEAPEAAEPEAAKAPEVKEQEETAKPEAPKPVVIRDVGFKTPESVYYDEANDQYLVSNINGSPDEADNNGFISKVSPEGTVTALTWIAGGQNNVTLNAPKGMGLKENTLYVTDINTVRMFDLATGEVKGEVKIKGATFLNDIAVGPTGTVYVSDSGLKSDEKGLSPSGTDAIWTISDGKAKKLIAGAELNRPNGLLADEGGVWVVAYGGTELYRVSDEGKREAPVNLPGGSLDGLVKTPDGSLLISSWQAQAVFRGQPNGTFERVLANIPSPADLAYDTKRNRMVVPIFQGDAIQIQELGQATAALRADAPEPETAASKAEAEAEAAEEANEAEAEKPAAETPVEPEPAKADDAPAAEKEEAATPEKSAEKGE